MSKKREMECERRDINIGARITKSLKIAVDKKKSKEGIGMAELLERLLKAYVAKDK